MLEYSIRSDLKTITFTIPVIPHYMNDYLLWCQNKGYNLKAVISSGYKMYPENNNDLVDYLVSSLNQKKIAVAYAADTWEVEKDLYYARIKGGDSYLARGTPIYFKKSADGSKYDLVEDIYKKPDKKRIEDWAKDRITEEVVDFEPVIKDKW